MDILRFYVYLIEKYLMKAGEGRGAFGREREKLADIEHLYFLEVDFTFSVELDESAVDYMSALACTESEDAFAIAVDELSDVFYNFLCDKISSFGGCLIHACVDFFLTAEGCQLDLAIRIVIAPGNAIQFYLAAKICFHFMYSMSFCLKKARGMG